MVTASGGKPENFSHRVTLSVSIRTTPDVLFDHLTDIENLSTFFPRTEFERTDKKPLRVGSIYHTRQKGAKTWVPYRVVALEKNARMSAMLVGKDPLFSALRYDHRFIAKGRETVSHEVVDYTFRFGLLGRILNLIIGKRLVTKQVMDAHLMLRKTVEQGRRPA